MKDDLWYRIAKWIRPEIDSMALPIKAFALYDILAMVPQIPLTIIGLSWLVAATNWSLFRTEWLLFLMLAILYGIFDTQSFQLQISFSRTTRGYTGSSFGPFLDAAAFLILGPTTIWIPVLYVQYNIFEYWRSRSDPYYGWNRISNYFRQMSATIMTRLVGTLVYETLGGQYPPVSFALEPMAIAAIALTASVTVAVIVGVPTFISIRYALSLLDEEYAGGEGASLRSGLIVVGIAIIMGLLATFAAGLYSEMGISIFLLFLASVFLAARLSASLSKNLAISVQRSREVESLQALGRDIIATPPDASMLPELLADHVPAMLTAPRIEIWHDGILYQRDFDTHVDPEPGRTAILSGSDDYYLVENINRPSLPRRFRFSLLGVPIKAADGKRLGTIQYLATGRTPEEFQPILESLASQISAAINRAEAYRQSILSEKMAQELAVAGQIQSSFLPRHIPVIAGYDLIATIVPARETSGDFYDLIDLGADRFGILVADVADKGTGAALYMALSRTLIRTYALEHPDDPAEALRLANERILQDTDSEQFVTVFYGILQPETGRFFYANAGHNPTLYKSNGTTEWLSQTGIPLGMFPGMNWENRELILSRNDLLVLYSDGITEAQSVTQAEFGEDRLLAALKPLPAASDNQLRQEAILGAINEFVGEAEQFDDMTLVILRRDAAKQETP